MYITTKDVKNLLHQNYKVDDIGKYKVSVLEDKYVVNGVKKRMTSADIKKYDVVFSCVDNMPFRKSLYEYGWDHPNKVFWVDGRCTSRQAAVYNSDLSKELLVTQINDSVDEAGCLLAYEKEQNISHAIPTIVAGIMVQTFLNRIRGQKTYKMHFMV